MKCSFCRFMNTLVKTLQLLAELASMICILEIASLSHKDPFKSHVIGNIEKYYNYPSLYNEIPSLEDVTSDRIIINETPSTEKIFNNTLSDEIRIEEANKISEHIFNYKKYFKRKIESDSFCTDIHESFVRNEGRMLSYIFDLNYETIYGLSLAILLVLLFQAALVILMCYVKIKKCTIITFGIIAILLWIAKFVLFILLFHFIEVGDVEKYDDFLDCKYVRKDYFKSFNDVEKFRKCFIAFTVLNLLFEIFDKAEKLFQPLETDVKFEDAINKANIYNSDIAINK